MKIYNWKYTKDLIITPEYKRKYTEFWGVSQEKVFICDVESRDIGLYVNWTCWLFFYIWNPSDKGSPLIQQSKYIVSN